MTVLSSSGPVLSTPATNIFEDGPTHPWPSAWKQPSDEKLYVTYEIARTIKEIREGRWKRIALQFPDEMLPDAPKVSQLIRNGLKRSAAVSNKQNFSPDESIDKERELVHGAHDLDLNALDTTEARPYILGDTSYGSCCVDEIAAEHISADVVVHYGRSCLSPTARLPVIYIFTQKLLDTGSVISSCVDTFRNRSQKIIVTGDVSYHYLLKDILNGLENEGYHELFATEVLHDPSSPLPNRSVPLEVRNDPGKLKEWDIFHISDPPEALLLTLSSRVRQFYIYPTTTSSGEVPRPLLAFTAQALRRRYALLTSVNTVSIFGILINTLSVKNYLHIVEHVKSQIKTAGKKSYTFVVGKINAAKVANFSEIGAWVVVGCWESSLIESKDFWRPVLMPFELELALKGDEERVWTGEWRSNFQEILDAAEAGTTNGRRKIEEARAVDDTASQDPPSGDIDSEEESAPPEFDLRTGRYVSHSRPMQSNRSISDGTNNANDSNALIKRAKGDLAFVGGEASPGAEFLRSKRTWKGLGSDFEIAYEDTEQAHGAPIEEGRSGIARGYVHGTDTSRT